MRTELTLSFLPVFLTRLARPRWRAAWLLALAMSVGLPWAQAQAAPLSAADEASVRAAVEGQLAALASDDAGKAFSFAAPNVRQAVGTAERFLAMVRVHYPAIYRPASAAFIKPESYGEPDQQGSQAIQRVHLLDDDGNAWVATYSLRRQSDNTWRITGCKVAPDKNRMT
ncbi:MAG: DUF4864 domain-containing protein [Polaromonas sp.]